jgi:hypothetical protein
MMTARVVLKKAKSYKFEGKRYFQDVPQTVHGEDEIKLFQENGFFNVTVLKGAAKKASKVSEDEEDAPKSKSGLKKR